MKKLNKTQEKFIEATNNSLATSFKVLKDYKAEGDYDMVRHMQREIESKLEGIVTWVIYYDHKIYEALVDTFDEMRKNPELKWEWAWELMEVK